MNNEKYPIRQNIIIDIIPVALMIEELFADYLVEPPTGAYIKGRIDPVLLEGESYHQRMYVDQPNGCSVAQAISVTLDDLSTIENVVYNKFGEVVVPKYASKMLSLTPSLPVIGIRLVRDLIDEYLRHLQIWHSWPIFTPNREHDVIEKYLSPTVKWYDDLLRDQSVVDIPEEMVDILPHKLDVKEELLLHFKPLQQELTNFVGLDNWHVHFTRLIGPRGILIAKSDDYRIFDWMERMDSGEWKR